MARTSSRKKPAVNYRDSPAAKDEASGPSTTPKATARGDAGARPKTAPKRKGEPADTDEAPRAAKRPKPKATARVKPKGGDEAMLLAARTAVTSLRKAMRIGAHVSAAGGMRCKPPPPPFASLPLSRGPSATTPPPL